MKKKIFYFFTYSVLAGKKKLFKKIFFFLNSKFFLNIHTLHYFIFSQFFRRVLRTYHQT
jgi:hypothetical protein